MYITLERLKRQLDIPIATTSDDVLLTEGIVSAAAFIESAVERKFEIPSSTVKRFNPHVDVRGRTLTIPEAASIVSVVNGDGTTVTSGQYTLEPQAGPYTAIKLLGSANVVWTYQTDPEEAIAVTAYYGYSLTPPEDIQLACLRLAVWLYRMRENRSGDQDRAVVTGTSTLLPSQMPSDVSAILRKYRKVTW